MLWSCLILLFTSFAAAQQRVAVTYFDAHTVDAELQPLGRAMADLLITDLSGAPGLVLVERARLADILAELALQRTDFIDPATAVRIGQGAGASRVVTGAISVVKGQLRLDARVIDVATGDVTATAQAAAPVEAFFEAERALAAALLQRMGLTGAARPPSVTALDQAVALGRAIDAVDLGKLDDARAILAGQPDHPARRALLAEIDARLGAARRQYDTAQTAAIQQGFVHLTACRDAGACEALAGFVHAWGIVEADAVTRADAQRFLREVIAAQLPAGLRFRQGALEGPLTAELALFRLHNSCFTGQDWPCVLATGDAYAQRFPTGAYLPAVQGFVAAARAMQR